MDLGSHPQSEPTTPPEYRTFNTNFSPKVSSGRANRHSTSYMASNSYIGSSRTSRAGSNLASPPSGLMEPFVGPTGLQSSTPNDYPSQSFPTSRRNSDEEFDGRQIQVDDQVNHRSAAALVYFLIVPCPPYPPLILDYPLSLSIGNTFVPFFPFTFSRISASPFYDLISTL